MLHRKHLGFINIVYNFRGTTMTRKELEIVLEEDIAPFHDPDVLSEQYVTFPTLAADFLWHLSLSTKLKDSSCVDLGCGTGMLGYGLLLLGTKHVTFVDHDGQALQQVEKLLAEQGITEERYTILLQSAQHVTKKADIYVQNPPFGTRKEHEDTVFLETALQNAEKVFTMHKTVTREHIVKKIRGLKHRIIYEQQYRYPLKKTLSHHTETKKYIDVSGFITQNINLKG